ncbi:hypothetical protein ES703_92789 [subsurface metagenome]
MQKKFDSQKLQGSTLLAGIESLEAGTVYLTPNATVTASSEAEVVLQFEGFSIGARRALGKGVVYLFSCLTVFGDRQLKHPGNRTLLYNLLEHLTAPSDSVGLGMLGLESRSTSPEVVELSVGKAEIGLNKPEEQEIIEGLTEAVMQKLAERKSEAEIVKELVNQGWLEESAKRLVNGAAQTLAETLKNRRSLSANAGQRVARVGLRCCIGSHVQLLAS